MKSISSRKNPVLTHLKKLAMDGAYRTQCGEFVCDGIKMLGDALKSGAEVTCVVTSDADFSVEAGDAPVYLVPGDVLGSVSYLKTTKDVLFSCKIREAVPEGILDSRVIILDGIQDPGNVGTILRSANAFRFDFIILTGGCADAYNPKTVRASMGAIFRQRFFKAEYDFIEDLVSRGAVIYGAAVSEGCISVMDVELRGKILAVGSEGNGLSEHLLGLCAEKIKIPMAEGCESLNAATAASVLMWTAFAER